MTKVVESLQLYRGYRKLSLFYKVFKDEHPKYIFNLFPVKSTPYATRTVDNISLIKTKHNFVKNSFFPSAIIKWNNLDPSLRNFKSVSVFKEKSTSRKFYIGRNNNKVNSIETGRLVIAHLFP